ncbi:hypothetical protein D9M68_799630 [compost metagenome]
MPGVPLSTRNAVNFERLSAAASVTAITIMKSARRAPLIHSLVPLSTHLPFLRSARVLMAAASEPAPGSDKARQLFFSPRE